MARYVAVTNCHRGPDQTLYICLIDQLAKVRIGWPLEGDRDVCSLSIGHVAQVLCEHVRMYVNRRSSW